LSYCPAVVAARRGAGLAGRPPRPPGRGGTPPLALEVRLDAVAAVLLDGLSYRRAGRAVGISKTEVGDSLAPLLGELGALGFCQPDGTFVTTLDDLRALLAEMATSGEAVCVDGLATRVQRPPGGATRRCCTTPSGTPTPPRAWRCRPSGGPAVGTSPRRRARRGGRDLGAARPVRCDGALLERPEAGGYRRRRSRRASRSPRPRPGSRPGSPPAWAAAASGSGGA
jgi:hypothetical protein